MADIFTCGNSAVEKYRPQSAKIECLPVDIERQTEEFVEQCDSLHPSMKTSVTSNEKPGSEEEFVGEIN